MADQLRPLLALWPVELAPHFFYRSHERGFQPAWLSILRDGSWRPDPLAADRFLVEAEVAPDDWWRLVVTLSTGVNVIVVLTVYPLSATQVAA